MTITGKLVDGVDGTPLSGGSIVLSSDQSKGTTSNDQGMFSVDVPDGSYLSVSYIGYDTRIEQASDFNGSVPMAKTGDVMSAVYVTAKKIIKTGKLGIVDAIVIVLFLKLFKLF